MALHSDPVTAEVVALICGLVERYNHDYDGAAARHELTRLQAKTLFLVEEPRPMRELARLLRCEPPNLTGIVNRLHGRGLVQRQSDPDDRRLKLVAITEPGAMITKDIRNSLCFAGEPLGTLDADERRRLRDLLRAMGEVDTEPALTHHGR